VSADDDADVKLPRETNVLFGHAQAEQAMLAAYKSGRVPHAWLIGGPPGVGKATLAYRFARFVLAHPDPAADAVQSATSLAVEPDDTVSRRVAAQAQSGLLVLERVINEQTGKLYTVIRIDDVRRSVPFFGSTAGEGGWRIAIVDSIDELQRDGANALLKILEEPPQRALLLLVSHAPGRELPTIRSRCRRLLLRPLTESDVAHAVAAASRRPVDEAVLAAARAAEGSVARALALLDEDAQELRRQTLDAMAQLPSADPRAVHAIGDALGSADPQRLATFMDMVNGWLSARLAQAGHNKTQMARIADTWQTVNAAARDIEAYNLERKPFAFAVFAALAAAAAHSSHAP